MKLSSTLPLLMSAIALLALGPCSRVPGGRLNGEVAAESPDDWSFVDDLGTCALETRPAAPHSVTVTCYSHQGELYVGSRRAPGKSWPRYVLEDARVRYRAGDLVYELIASRLEEPAQRNAVYASRRALGGAEQESDLEAPEDYWIFHLQPRTVAASPSAGGARAHAEAIAAAPNRSAEDRDRDTRRRPVELLVFAGVAPGMHVADLAAGSGYTTELLARAVGPEGRVYGHNTPATIQRYVADTWPARLEKEVLANVVRIDSEIDEPLPGARDLDLITLVFYYHDTLYMDVDRAKMNAAVFEALRPGGSLVVVDHHAKPGAEEAVAETLHRVDEQLVVSEIEAAGFRLVDEANFMRNPDDPRDEPFFELDMPTDAFVHRYVKPE